MLVPERAERGLAVLEELLAAFPLTNPQVGCRGAWCCLAWRLRKLVPAPVCAAAQTALALTRALCLS